MMFWRTTPSPTTAQTHPAIPSSDGCHVPEVCDVSKSLTAQPGQRVPHQRPVASASSAGGSAQSLWAGAGDHGEGGAGGDWGDDGGTGGGGGSAGGGSGAPSGGKGGAAGGGAGIGWHGQKRRELESAASQLKALASSS